jgi:hypothetical protein
VAPREFVVAIVKRIDSEQLDWLGSRHAVLRVLY